MDRQASWIARAVSGRLVGPDVTVTGPVVTDSREARPGSLYVARRGETADGHRFVPDAHRLGAVCAVVEHPVDAPVVQVVVEDSTRALGDLARAHLADLRQRGDLDVVAVTGSAGKTTTKDLLAQLLGHHAPTLAPKLSYNNEVGVPLTVLRADTTTRHLVLEMGASGPGHLAYLTRIAPPDIAVELMVGRAHLGGFGSQDDVARAKAELVEGLRPGGTAILNVDDPRVAAMAGVAPGPVVRFSTDPDAGADVWADGIGTDAGDHASFDLHHGEDSSHVHLDLVGLHHVHNALAAAATSLTLGCDLAEVARWLGEARALSPHRMAVTDLDLGGRRVTLVDDSYNANPDSVEAGLGAAAALAGGRRLVAVLGEMLELGPTSDTIHREVGRSSARMGVSALVTLGAGALPLAEAVPPGTEVSSASTPEEALDLLDPELRDGDVVLVKGSNGSGAWRVADALVERGTEK